MFFLIVVISVSACAFSAGEKAAPVSSDSDKTEYSGNSEDIYVDDSASGSVSAIDQSADDNSSSAVDESVTDSADQSDKSGGWTYFD